MNIFEEKRTELERHEFMMGLERGRLAVALDLLTDSLIMVGQHGVYCASSRNPSKPALDLQAVLAGMEGAKALIQSVMEELRAQREAARSSEYPGGRGRDPWPGSRRGSKYGMLIERARSSAG